MRFILNISKAICNIEELPQNAGERCIEPAVGPPLGHLAARRVVKVRLATRDLGASHAPWLVTPPVHDGASSAIDSKCLTQA